MKQYSIVWSDFAEWNLGKIYKYLLKESLSEQVAKKFIENLISKAEQLEKFPFSGQKELILINLKYEFRYLVFKDYKVIYFVEKDIVYITDIFHSKLSPKKLIKRNK